VRARITASGSFKAAVEEVPFAGRAAGREQLEHFPPDRCIELAATSKRVLAFIGEQDRLEGMLNSAMVAPMLLRHAHDEWQHGQHWVVTIPIARFTST
jgi:hypothetical protein